MYILLNYNLIYNKKNMNPVEEVIVKQRIKNIADNLGVYYLVKNMSIKEVYHFLSDYFFQTEQLDITKYSFEEMNDMLDENIGCYSSLLSDEVRLELFCVATDIYNSVFRKN